MITQKLKKKIFNLRKPRYKRKINGDITDFQAPL